MRYSFHGKVRATGQQVDGFVEAETASRAIDRLADKGIIGVYSVRPEPKPPRHAVLTGDEAARAAKEAEDARTGKSDRRVRALPAPQAVVAPATDASTAEILKQLVDKIAALTGKVESLLARPASVVYQSGGGGPARNAGLGGKKRSGGDVQNSTLRDIFQNNLDLRHSLEKLATTVGPPVPVAVRPSESAPRESLAPSKREQTNGSHEPINKTRELVAQAQPAA